MAPKIRRLLSASHLFGVILLGEALIFWFILLAFQYLGYGGRPGGRHVPNWYLLLPLVMSFPPMVAVENRFPPERPRGTRRGGRFWGQDRAVGASVYVDGNALTRIAPDVSRDEGGFLNAFEANRDKICAAAAKVYVRGSRGSYDLGAANF